LKNNQWLAEVTEKDTAKLLLIGSQLSQWSQKKRGPIFMTLGLLGGTGKVPTRQLQYLRALYRNILMVADQTRFILLAG
jgi:hypothetical protein